MIQMHIKIINYVFVQKKTPLAVNTYKITYTFYKAPPQLEQWNVVCVTKVNKLMPQVSAQMQFYYLDYQVKCNTTSVSQAPPLN